MRAEPSAPRRGLRRPSKPDVPPVHLSATARRLRQRCVMLRITAEKRDAGWVLKLEGNLQGEWVTELRRSWRDIRDAAAPTPVCVELNDVQFVDAAGKLLLTEMHREGVAITARGFLARAIREEIVTSSSAKRHS